MRSDIDRLIQQNKGLVYKQLHRFHMSTDPDAESFAYEALWHAAEDFDETKGNKFSTVATVYIYNALCGYLRQLNAKRQLEVVSYNAIIKLSNGEKHEYLELLESDHNVEGDFMHKERIRYLVKYYRELLEGITNEKQRKIIIAWTKSGFEGTASSIAKRTGLSQSYVSQTITNFKFELKKLMEERYDKSN